MNRKIASYLLICLVLVSLICSYSGIALYRYATSSEDLTLSETGTTQESQEKGRLLSSEPYQRISGDKVKDIKPH